MPSERQIGLIEDGRMTREPELCAVIGRDVRGKHAVTHYGPNGQFVYVLAQVDHLWPQAAPAYGFPVPSDQPAEKDDVFVLSSNETGRLTVTDSDGAATEHRFSMGTDFAADTSDRPSLQMSRRAKSSPPVPGTSTQEAD